MQIYKTIIGVVMLATSLPAVAQAAVPGNDSVTNATPAHLGFTDVLDTTDATSTPTETNLFIDGCGYDEWARSVWYRITPARDTVVHVDTTRSDYFAAAAVFTGPVDDLSRLKCGSQTLDFTARAGDTYYVGVVNYDYNLGTFLRISFTQGLPEPSVKVRVNEGAEVSTDGAVRIRGSYACRNANTVAIELTLTQHQLPRDNAGWFRQPAASDVVYLANARCDGAAHPWSIVLTSGTDRRFTPGSAELTADYDACSTYCSSEATLTRQIDLSPASARR